jgi:hypothetical protein
MKHPRTIFIAFVTLLLTFVINLTYAASDPLVLPPNSKVYGKSNVEWSADWLKWALPIPAGANPILDTTGDYAAVGQTGKVWFLAGVTGSGDVPPVVRTISIPEDTYLFFPIVNYFWVNTPETGDAPWSSVQEANVRNILSDIVDTATGLSLEIDGSLVLNLADYRLQSADDHCRIPPLGVDNIFGVDLRPNAHPCVADGYWVMVRPLPAGSHKIKFTGGLSGFSLDVTYNITVQPGHKKVKVPLHP